MLSGYEVANNVSQGEYFLLKKSDSKYIKKGDYYKYPTVYLYKLNKKGKLKKVKKLAKYGSGSQYIASNKLFYTNYNKKRTKSSLYSVDLKTYKKEKLFSYPTYY